MISATIITLNEQRNIGRCLASISNLVEDITIVDSGSKDNTIAIAKSFPNTTVINQQWLGYAQQKNYANAAAKYDWILSLDADEAINPILANSILNIKQQLPASPLMAAATNRLTNYCGKWIRHGGWYPDTKVRLFNRRTARWHNSPIHEHLSLDYNTKIIKLKGDILHYSYNSIEEHILQANKFSTLAANAAKQSGQQTSPLNLIINPKWKFFKDYFLRLGFLDGRQGYNIAKISSFATWLKYTKIIDNR